jgi:CarD family transcriptional regulator
MTRRTDKAAAARRTASQPARGIARGAAPAAKKTGNRKGAGEGVLPGMPTSNKKTTQRQGFKTNEFIVYPAHGVGQILAIEEQEVAGAKLELFVITFVKDKMTLRVPTAKIVSVGMRKLAEPPVVKRALETLKGRARIKRTMWSRRAQEYEAKINSGDIVAIAEVVRDLFRSDTQPEQSYSERQLYEAAVDRLSREIAAVQKITETEAIKEIEGALAKGPRRGPKPAGEAEAEGETATEDEAA